MTDRLHSLQTRLGYGFQDEKLLAHALTHGSAAAAGGTLSYERLEFLGDRVLGLVVADLLYRAYPADEEGDLAVRLNSLVRAETCTEVAQALDLGAAMKMTRGELKAGTAKRGAVLADVCEAVIAAIYLDGGFDAAADFVRRNWEPRLAHMSAPQRDAKTRLQEWAQAARRSLPKYEAIGRSGPDHAPVFDVRVSIEGVAPAVASGSSKRAAEQAAAQKLLEREGVAS